MTWRSTAFVERRSAWLVMAVIALGVAVFLVAVGLGPGALPYPTQGPYSDAAITHWPNALNLHRYGPASWYPRIMSGIPFAANPLSKVWYPPQWAALLLEPTLHLNLMIWFHLTLAGAGMWAWTRASGMRAGPAVLAAAAYTLAPKIIAHLGAGHLDIVYAMGWFPWLMWAVESARAGDRANISQAGGRPGSGWLEAGLRIGVIAALLFLADVRVSAYAFAVAGVYALWSLRRVGPVLIGALAALALTAAQWLPLAALGPYLSRGALTPDEAAAFSIAPEGLLGVALGNHAGFHETMTYTGLCVLLLAGVGVLARPRRLVLWVAVVVLAALYTLGDNGPLWPLLTAVFPALTWLRVPSRAWLVVALALPYMAGWGAQALTERWRGAGRAIQPIGSPLALTALLAGAVMCSGASALSLTDQLGAPVTLAALAVALAAAGIIALAASGRLSPRTVALLLLTVTLADLLWIDRTLVEGRGREYWLDPYAPLADYLVEAGVGRVYTPSDSLPQQAAANWEINLFGGVDPFQIASYVEMAGRATGVPAERYTPTIPPYTGEGPVETMWAGAVPDADLMSLWNVTHAVSAFPIEGAGWRLEGQIDGVYIYANTRRVETIGVEGLPPGATAYTLPGGSLGRLAVSVPWLPGWEARVGAASPLADVTVKPGPHALTIVATRPQADHRQQAITLSFNPVADRAGAGISAGAAALAAALYWQTRRTRLRADAPTNHPA